jgi:hypothetical protein
VAGASGQVARPFTATSTVLSCKRERDLRFKSEGSVTVAMAVVSGSLAKRFTADPAGVFLDAIRASNEPLTAAKVKQPLIDAGLPKATVDSKWKTAQQFLKKHPHLRIVKRVNYQWSDSPIAPATALDLLLEPRIPQWLKEALAEAVRQGLSADVPSPAAATPAAATPAAVTTAPAGGDALLRAAQELQWKIDTVRAVAEIAAEVEEIAYNGADPDLILERVRTRALGHQLAPIGESGQDIGFDPAQHKPLTGFPDPGSTVFVVRPGYTWRSGQDDVLIERAVVATD